MLRVFALLCALATSVQAKMMTHEDLAGLALTSDLVVSAERVSKGHYKIVKVLRGTTSAKELALDDSLYAIPDGASTSCYVFVQNNYIAHGGLRVVVAGKVFRYEQRNNPGGWDAVPQGQDPQDQWRTTAQLEVAAFEQALTAAFARADRVNAALAKQATRDQLIGLLSPSGDARASGFYVDEVAARIEAALAARGDWAGVVEAIAHDHRGVDVPRFTGHANDLLAVARDDKQPEPARARAVHEAGEDFSLDADYLPLLADGSPLVRAEAVRAAARRFGTMSSDPKEQKRIDAQKSAAKAAFAKLAKTETANVVRAALADTVPITGYAGSFEIVADDLLITVHCTGKAEPKGVEVTREGAPFTVGAFNLTLTCGSGLGGGIAKPFPDGAYRVSANVARGGKVENVPLGAFAVVSGEILLAPR